MIRFDQVTKTYAGTSRPALDGVNLEVLKGEFVFLVGASGSGKSSFLRLVLKEERPTRGQIHVLGQQLGSLPNRKVPYFRRNLGVVFQDFRLLPNKTVFDNVAFTLQVIGKSKGFIQEAVPDVLKMVGLAGKQGRYPHELSGGEQQRVAIARAIVNKPAILLADEPTGNLDPATSMGIMTLLATINANGTTVLMATHDSGIVDQMKRRVIELVSGHIVRDEMAGGYQTQAIPVQRLDIDESLAPRGPSAATGLISTVRPDAEADSGVAAAVPPPAPASASAPAASAPTPTAPAPESPAPESSAPEQQAPEQQAPERQAPEPAPRPVTTPIAVRPATPKPAPQSAPAPQAAPARRPASGDAPPPLVDPLAADRERSA
ncbi:cell division ATP-binding protein FtsE [Pseudolysinimonas sp.]|uniref:cell division ATP-binding protein FtsE n=1 Tax=Pseudolysinimonas sp. TaxID=2680009 RepID=UPI003F80A56E